MKLPQPVESALQAVENENQRLMDTLKYARAGNVQFRALRSAIETALQQPGTCTWTEDPSGDYWAATCGDQLFTFTDGGPVENGLKCCCFCGKALVAQTAVDAAR